MATADDKPLNKFVRATVPRSRKLVSKKVDIALKIV